MDNQMERSFAWDDVIEKDSEFKILPAGDYRFTVKSFERARHNGSDKLPPCNKAIVTLDLTDGEHTGTLTHNLFLHAKCEGMLCAFFTAIGQRKHGEPLKMNWQAVVGSTGRCKVGVRDWKSRDGEARQSNDIKCFYEPETAPVKAYKEGKF